MRDQRHPAPQSMRSKLRTTTARRGTLAYNATPDGTAADIRDNGSGRTVRRADTAQARSASHGCGMSPDARYLNSSCWYRSQKSLAFQDCEFTAPGSPPRLQHPRCDRNPRHGKIELPLLLQFHLDRTRGLIVEISTEDSARNRIRHACRTTSSRLMTQCTTSQHCRMRADGSARRRVSASDEKRPDTVNKQIRHKHDHRGFDQRCSHPQPVAQNHQYDRPKRGDRDAGQHHLPGRFRRQA